MASRAVEAERLVATDVASHRLGTSSDHVAVTSRLVGAELAPVYFTVGRDLLRCAIPVRMVPLLLEGPCGFQVVGSF